LRRFSENFSPCLLHQKCLLRLGSRLFWFVIFLMRLICCFRCRDICFSCLWRLLWSSSFPFAWRVLLGLLILLGIPILIPSDIHYNKHSTFYSGPFSMPLLFWYRHLRLYCWFDWTLGDLRIQFSWNLDLLLPQSQLSSRFLWDVLINDVWEFSRNRVYLFQVLHRFCRFWLLTGLCNPYQSFQLTLFYNFYRCDHFQSFEINQSGPVWFRNQSN